MRSLGVLASTLAVLVGVGGVFLCRLVIALFVVESSLVMMVSSRMVVRRCILVVLGGRMFRHGSAPHFRVAVKKTTPLDPQRRCHSGSSFCVHVVKDAFPKIVSIACWSLRRDLPLDWARAVTSVAQPYSGNPSSRRLGRLGGSKGRTNLMFPIPTL
jgi:hypothetical protein